MYKIKRFSQYRYSIRVSRLFSNINYNKQYRKGNIKPKEKTIFDSSVNYSSDNMTEEELNDMPAHDIGRTIYNFRNKNPNSYPTVTKEVANDKHKAISEQEERKSQRWKNIKSPNKLKLGKKISVGKVSILENLSDMYNTKDMDSDKSKNYFLKKSVTPSEIEETEKFYNKEKERKLRNTIF